MDRPALQSLMRDVSTGLVDVIVVYKIDRLTRSLADFAKMVEVFEAKGVSFVSVTQQFNTTTSMGRLTLNVLLSFAQFEREVTAERIRDKIAASRKKGMWMGGPPPLGYDVREKKLVANQAEAKVVQQLFEAYLRLGSTKALAAWAKSENITTKIRKRSDGSMRSGGRPSLEAISTPCWAIELTSVRSRTREISTRASRRRLSRGIFGRLFRPS